MLRCSQAASTSSSASQGSAASLHIFLHTTETFCHCHLLACTWLACSYAL